MGILARLARLGDMEGDLILEAAPGSAWWLHAGAALLLFAHIAGATLGLISGAVAILAPKGERAHRAAGNVFFVSMLVMAGVAAVIAPLLPDARWTNTTAAVFTFYLVATAWATVKRPEGQVGVFEVGAFLAAFGLAAMGLALAVIYGATPRASSFATVYIFAGVAAIAAAGDFKMIRRGGLVGAPRIARHLWRMCVALLIAAGSFFVGQQDELPAFMQGSPLLFAPMLATLGLMIFWLLRVRFTGASRRNRPLEIMT